MQNHDEFFLEIGNEKKVPSFFRVIVREMIKSGNNLLILSEADTNLFELCRDMDFVLEVKVDYLELVAYENKINDIFKNKVEGLKNLERENMVRKGILLIPNI